MKASRAPPTLEHARRRGARRAPGCAKAGQEDRARCSCVRQPAAAAVGELDVRVAARAAPGRRAAKSFERPCGHSAAGRASAPAIAVVGGAGALRRHHRRAERMLGRAARAEGRALGRLAARPCRTRPLDALGRLVDADVGRRRSALGVEARDSAARRPRPLCGISPMPRQLRGDDLEDLARSARCAGALPSRRTDARVLVLDLGAALLELLHAHVGCPAGGRAARSR